MCLRFHNLSFLFQKVAFPREYRLPSGRMMETVFQRGVRKTTPFFRAFVLPIQKGNARFAVAVSVRTEPSAVKRNRIRRRITEAARHVFSELRTAKPRLLCVFLGKSAAIDADFDLLTSTISQVLQHSSLPSSHAQNSGHR